MSNGYLTDQAALVFIRQVDWQKLISGMFSIINLPITADEPILAIAPPFLEKIGELISRQTPR